MHLNIITPFLLLLFGIGIYARCGHFFSDCASYCKLYPQHVLCLGTYKGKNCTEPFVEAPARSQEIKHILEFHNKMRQKVSVGLETKGRGGPQPPAANMMKMEWDLELARMAQSSANKCAIRRDCKKCKGVLGGRFLVGQLVSSTTGPLESSSRAYIKILSKWYNTVSIINPANVDSFVPYQYYRPYSQMIWWNTRSVGCGGAAFPSEKKSGEYRFLIFCNYGPAGSVQGAKMYIKGAPCSKCPEATVCDRGLCAIPVYCKVKDLFWTDQTYLGVSDERISHMTSFLNTKWY